MTRIDIKSLSKAALQDELGKMGEPSYRARQIFKWLYRAGVRHFDDMTDISVDLRHAIKERFHITRLVVSDTKRSALDGTTKYLFRLEDGNTIETVFLPEKDRSTICLSSQVGCKFACSFCASAPFGFMRNLKQSEILDEVLWAAEGSRHAPITNLVFMGIGEPFDNYENVLGAIRIFNDKDAFMIGARKITISTCGIIPGIEKLKKEGLQVELSVSLHAADDGIRSKLLPINKRYPIREVIRSCREYTSDTNRVVTFEYILLKGVNSSKEDAVKLADILKGMKCKVNVIYYNRIALKKYQPPSNEDAVLFINTLEGRGINVTLRKSKGEDIDAGCGQLRITKMADRDGR